MVQRHLAFVLILVFLAGCLQTAEPVAPDGSNAEALGARLVSLVDGVPCEASVGESTSDNLVEVAKHALDEHGYVSIGELWLQGERAYVARYGTGGFVTLDISDPSEPKHVATWDPDQTDRALDVKLVPDGTAVLVGRGGGIDLVDVRDEETPVLEYELRFSSGSAHMMSVFDVANVTYVAASTAEGEDLPIYRIEGDAGSRSLVKVASPRIGLTSWLLDTWNPQGTMRAHDSFYFYDPLLDKPTVWVAAVWDGLVLLDVSNPTAPSELARIPVLKPQYTHTVQTVVLDGQRITISISEIGTNTMRVYDTTDLSSPVLLAEWSIEAMVKPQHNLQIVAPYVYVAHYEEGVYVFDLDQLLAGQAAPIARLASLGETPQTGNTAVDAFAATGIVDGAWDVGLANGLMFVTDSVLRVVAFGCVLPGDATVRSVG